LQGVAQGLFRGTLDALRSPSVGHFDLHCGADAEPLPQSDELTLELGRKYTTGKECYPSIITTGDIVKKTLTPEFDAGQAAVADVAAVDAQQARCRAQHFRTIAERETPCPPGECRVYTARILGLADAGPRDGRVGGPRTCRLGR